MTIPFILIINWVINIYILILLVRVIFSWVSPRSYHPIYIFAKKLTEPLLKPFRRWGYYRSGNMIYDITPMLLVISLLLLRQVLFALLHAILAK